MTIRELVRIAREKHSLFGDEVLETHLNENDEVALVRKPPFANFLIAGAAPPGASAIRRGLRKGDTCSAAWVGLVHQEGVCIIEVVGEREGVA